MCYIILYYTILCYTILYYTILYYTTICYAMLCMLCYAIPSPTAHREAAARGASMRAGQTVFFGQASLEQTSLSLSISISLSLYIYIYMCIYIYVSILSLSLSIYLSVYVYIYIYIYTHVYTYVCTGHSSLWCSYLWHQLNYLFSANVCTSLRSIAHITRHTKHSDLTNTIERALHSTVSDMPIGRWLQFKAVVARDTTYEYLSLSI